MNKQDIISFFDEYAPAWDKEQVRNESVINKILDNGSVKEGSRVLDVACGTGVLFEDYLRRNVKNVTGIDISPEMVKIAREKFPEINVICGDAETVSFETEFDTVMIYNAFPHFPDPKSLMANLAKALKKGGRLSVAHGMSREELEKHHSKAASKVSLPLPDANTLAETMKEFFEVDIIISDRKMYQVSGIKK